MKITFTSRNSSYSHSATPPRSTSLIIAPSLTRATPLLRSSAPANSRSRAGWFLRWSAPLILFAVGISALGYCAYVMLDAHYSQNDQSRQFDQALLATHNSAGSGVGSHPESAVDSAATAPLMPVFLDGSGAANESSVASTKSAAASAENLPLGRIEITSIGLKAMIQEGTGRITLQRGVGHIVGTSLLGASGNIGLAGHRDTFFRQLRNIHEGAEITLTTLEGKFLYRVDQISIVEPEDSQVLRDSGENLLTLVTCYPFSYVGPSPKRFIVRAHQVPTDPSATAIQ
jgi:sortase A